MKKPEVAVITRTKDRPLFLARAIISVQAQTMTDFIQIIVNDAGNRSAVEKVLKEHEKIIRSPIKVIHNKVSNGMEAATNKAINSVDSKYIAIHDDDDSWHPDFLLETTKHLESTGSMGVVAAADRILETIKDGKIHIIKKERWLPGVSEINLYKQCLDQYAITIAFVYQRSALETVGLYDESLPVAADWDFAIRFLLEYDIDFLEHEPALANYHHRPDIKGKNGNSVFASRDLHEYYYNVLRNKYLRHDIKKGRIGIGYIMNSLKYQRDISIEKQKQDEQQTVRIEGHINYVAQQINKHIDETAIRIINHNPIYRVAHKIRDKKNSE